MTIDHFKNQQLRNHALVESSRYMRSSVTSQVLPFSLDLKKEISPADISLIQAIEIEAAKVALRSLASLAKINELDHLGGGLELIPALAMTLAVTDHKKVFYTIEHAHTSIGYYSLLAVLGYLDENIVIDGFRRGLDIAGHVSWVPGGTELNGGRLGVMVPAAVGQALGLRAHHGSDAWVICHTGDAGWISGQALNGFNGADLHDAPITFVMNRNAIQLSGASKHIMDKDPRPVIEALGVEIIEVSALYDTKALHQAYRDAKALAEKGRPSLIFPVGRNADLAAFGAEFGITREVEALASKNSVPMNQKIWIQGSLMSYRDVPSMIECVFLVNDLPGGAGHHDGHMKGRDLEKVLANPMLQGAIKIPTERKTVLTEARPSSGTANLVLSDSMTKDIALPPVGKPVSARAGVEAAYAAIAKNFPDQMFVVSCDLDPSTKLEKARKFLKADHQFEMSIEEQASAIMANGLAVSSRAPQLNVFSTFAAFFEGIAREGLEMWRYQRNLNGVNEGLNVAFHLSHVGSCTGRDHFSGWSLDWIPLSLGYLPYLHRFYAPSDARSAFVAVRDMAAHYGGHILAIPRDNLPVLAKEDGSPLWETNTPWESVTRWRMRPGAKKVILAFGAPAYVAGEAADACGEPVDVLIVNGLPFEKDVLPGILAKYTGGIVTIEDGIIATPETGLRGFAGLIRSAAYGSGIPLDHIGIVDPCTAPAEGHQETWEHFGITKDALIEAVKAL